MGRKFTAFLKEHGIERQSSVPYSPQQNGRAERWQQTIVYKAEAMRHHAGLSPGFWKLACEAAVYINNRLPLKRLEWVTPIEAFSGQKPDLSTFRVFGCKAYVHIPKDNRSNKLTPKATSMIFVGYEPGYKGYRFWDKRRVVLARDAVFNETEFPNRTDISPSKPTPNGDDNIPLPDNDSPLEDDDDSGHSTSGDGDDDHPAPQAPNPQHRQQPPRIPRIQTPPVVPRRSNRVASQPVPPVTRPTRSTAGKNPRLGGNPVEWEKNAERNIRHDRRVEASHDRLKIRNRPSTSRSPVPGPSRLTRAPGISREPSRTESVDEPSDDLGSKDPDDITEDPAETINRIATLYSLEEQEHPQSWKQAMKDSRRELWHVAAQDEIASHKKNGTWVLVKRPDPSRKIVKCKWVFTIKSDGRYKARLVAKGFTQVEGIDYQETFSPVARFESIRTLLALAALEDWDVEALDVKTAFLYGDLDEEIYMEQPEGFVEKGKENHVCLLRKAIYGLKQASRTWNIKIHNTLLSLGFERIHSDAGVYVYRQQGGNLIVILYVDDIFPMGSNKLAISALKKNLMDQYEMRDLGEAKLVLGMRVQRDRKKRTLIIDQSSYVQSALKRFNMVNANPARTPLPSGIDLHQPESGYQADSKLRSQYQALIGTLIYVMIGTRPDIGYAVIRLSQYMSNPTEAHFKAAKYILKFLVNSHSLGIKYDGGSKAGLIGYSDADWAENKDNRHSTTGYAFLLAGGAISWISSKQKVIALSSMEAEYIALCEAAKQAQWLRQMFMELDLEQTGPTVLCCDNHGAIFFTKNPKTEKRSKHIDIRYHFIREFVEAGQAELFAVPTEEQVADIMTKSLAQQKHSYFSNKLGLVNVE